VRVFDAQHERRRKEQLEKLFHRTEEQVIFHLRVEVSEPKSSYG